MKLLASAFTTIAAAAFILCAATAGGQEPGSATGERAALLERGRYLVHDVAMCVQCHTPRDEKGDLIAGKLLQGAPVPVSSPFPNRSWASRSPYIAGLPGYQESDLLRLLTEGLGRDGGPPQPPMPPFRMSRDDAEAVIAYLISLRERPGR